MPATRSQPAADRNLLFGVLALQMDFISRDALVGAMNAWVLDKARPLGLILVFVYAFFKFAWSYRLFNYVAILLGGMPPASQRDTKEAEAHVIRTSRLFEAAGRHFNRGQRAFFFALGYLGWFVSPWALFLTTAMVVVVTWRRQFASDAWRAMATPSPVKS